MVDTRTKEQRSRIMKSVRTRHTGPEMTVRKLAHRMGFRFRLHGRDLPGRPDLVFRSARKAIFVNGCFWHGHECCAKGRLPKSRTAYWAPKIARNKERDAEAIRRLERDGWKTLTIWQCEIRDPVSLETRLRGFLGAKRKIRSTSGSPRSSLLARAEGASPVRPIAVDLFSGAGGMSLGFEQAGFDVAAAVELDPVHCATHLFNFPHCAVIPQSVSETSAAQVRLAAGIGSRPVDCVFGGPPCQGFSLIGHRTLDDPRNALVRDFVRLVAELDSRTFVFENVKGLTVGLHRLFLDELVHAFEEAGYYVRLPWRICDAANYGVPQRRERLILLGAKKGSPLPAYPERETTHADEPELGLPLGPTCGAALADLPNADIYGALRFGDSVRSLKWGKPSAYAAPLRCITKDAWHHGYRRKWDDTLLTSSWRTEHSAISQRRFSETPGGTVEPISRFFRLDAGGLSNTLRAGTDGPRGAFTSPRPIHYRFDRCITVREMARLHGFPDWFRFHATKWHGARQVGNAVPPPLAKAIARGVFNALSAASPSRPRKTLALGDEALLRMEVSEAASYFGIPKPKTGRDRKSGARKRKQHEIEQQRLLTLVAAE